MKILVLAPYSRPWDSGDAEGSGMNVFIKESTEALVEAGHEVKVCLRRSREHDNFSEQKGKNLKIFFIDAGLTKKIDRHSAYYALKKSSLNNEILEGVDLVIAHYWLSEPWIQQVAQKYNGRILYFSHSFSLNPHRDSYDPLHLKSETTITPRVTWCAYSKAEFSIMTDVFPEGRIFYIRPGVKLDENLPETTSRTNEVLFIGRKNHAKGYDLFCEMSKFFPDFSFVAIGREEEFGSDNRVLNVDFMPLPELKIRIASARLVVCPSRYEHFGLIPLLSLLLQTPVVTSNRGGFTDVIEVGETGEICEPDFESLRIAMEKCLNDIKAPIAKEKAIALAENYSWKSWEHQVSEIGMKADNLLKTRFLNVSITPKKVNNQIVWFEKVSLPGSVHVLPQNKNGSYEFIIEDRPQENSKNKLRVLSGIIEKDEEPIQAAHRELLEEMGWQADSMELLWHSTTKGTVGDHRYYFIARNILNKKNTTFETTEIIKGTKSLTKEEILKRVKKGEFGESHTAIALFKLCGILSTDRK